MVATLAPLPDETSARAMAHAAAHRSIDILGADAVFPDAEEYEGYAQAPSQAPPARCITLRAMTRRDVPQIQQLHEEWFPIRYQQVRFIESLATCSKCNVKR